MCSARTSPVGLRRREGAARFGFKASGGNSTALILKIKCTLDGYQATSITTDPVCTVYACLVLDGADGVFLSFGTYLFLLVKSVAIA